MKLSNPVADGYCAMVRRYVGLNWRLVRQVLHVAIMDTKAIVGNTWAILRNLWWMIVSLIGDWWREKLTAIRTGEGE